MRKEHEQEKVSHVVGQPDQPRCPTASASEGPLPAPVEPALFIPLKTEFYEAFVAGTKREELRRYGPRWNERVCRIGRPVVLGKGYGRISRHTGRIVGFYKQHGTLFGSGYKASLQRIYGTLDFDVAVIAIDLDAKAEGR